MRLSRKLLATACVIGLLAAYGTAHAVPTLGPHYPPTGGVTFSQTGVSAGDPAGLSFYFSAFNPSAFTELYWGPSGTSPSRLGAGLDGNLYALNWIGISGTTSFWRGTSPWTNPQTQQVYAGYTELRINVSGLGANPWVPANTVGGTVVPTLGAVVDNWQGLNFTANLQFLGNVGGGWQPLNTIQQGYAGLTRSSFDGGFYDTPSPVVPEPTTVILLGLGLAGIGAARRRKQ